MIMTTDRLKQYEFIKREFAELTQNPATAISGRATALQKEISEFETFIGGIQRNDIRQIFQYRYMQGLSWKVVSKKVYGYLCESRPRRAAERYLKGELKT